MSKHLFYSSREPLKVPQGISIVGMLWLFLNPYIQVTWYCACNSHCQ